MGGNGYFQQAAAAVKTPDRLFALLEASRSRRMKVCHNFGDGQAEEEPDRGQETTCELRVYALSEN